MARSQPDAKWPYVAVALGLFGLTLLAPRIWRPEPRPAARHASEPTRDQASWLPASARAPIKPLMMTPAPRVAKQVAGATRSAPMAPERKVGGPPEVRELSVTDESPPPVRPPVWPRPVALREALERLQAHAATREWADGILTRLSELEQGEELPPERFLQVVAELDAAAKQAESIHGSLDLVQPELGSAVLRAQYALERRLDVWQALYQLAHQPRNANGELRVTDASVVIKRADRATRPNEARATRQLLEPLEEYEQSRPPSAGLSLMAAQRQLAASAEPAARELGRRLESHYRNANLRLSLSGVMLNRMLPQPKSAQGDVDDTVGGFLVRGRRWTDTRVQVRLLPDDRQIRLGLEAHGDVVSHTHSTSGPATVFSAGQSRFVARKLVLFDGLTLRQYPAIASADADTVLSGIRTDFDALPFFGSFVRSIARSRYDAQQDDTRLEVEEKIAWRASDEFQQQAGPKLVRLAKGWQDHIIQPLTRLNLRPTPISQTTDEQRIALRYRLAGDNQPGGHTSRPRAPSDSLMSLQIHESAINNAIENFALCGRTFELRSLYDRLAERLGHPDLKAPDDVPEEVLVTFADEDCLHVRFDSGKAQVELRIKDLVADKKRWQNLVIRAEYQPATTGLDAQLARIEAVQVAGDRLSTKSHVTLKAIFSRMFTRNRQVRLTPEQIARDQRLTDLHVSQLVIEDGWIGLAVGVNRIAAKPAPQASKSLK
jgi:hypothetical protein